MKKAEYIARSGSVQVPVKREANPDGDGFRVYWRGKDWAKKRFFRDLAEAKAFASLKARELSLYGDESLTVSGAELLVYRRARGIAEGVGVSLDTLADEYRRMKELLGDKSPLDVCREYAATRGTVKAPPITEVVQELLASKKQLGRSTRHLRDLKARLKWFSDAVRIPLKSLTSRNVEAWLGGLKIAHRTRRNYLAAVSNLVTFAERKGYVAKGQIDLGNIERGTDHAEVAIFTPEELSTLLSTCRPDMVPYIAIGAFAGLRSAEICRLDWSEIRDGHIDVKAKKSKTRQRRIVPVHATLAKWLEPHAQESGPVCRLVDPWLVLKPRAVKAGVVWKPNALRHSYGTYRMAIEQNESKVALEMGNTPSMVFAHYRAIATRETAERWFSVLPK